MKGRAANERNVKSKGERTRRGKPDPQSGKAAGTSGDCQLGEMLIGKTGIAEEGAKLIHQMLGMTTFKRKAATHPGCLSIIPDRQTNGTGLKRGIERETDFSF